LKWAEIFQLISKKIIKNILSQKHYEFLLHKGFQYENHSFSLKKK